jgi:hypothetical protein
MASSSPSAAAAQTIHLLRNMLASAMAISAHLGVQGQSFEPLDY